MRKKKKSTICFFFFCFFFLGLVHTSVDVPQKNCFLEFCESFTNLLSQHKYSNYLLALQVVSSLTCLLYNCALWGKGFFRNMTFSFGWSMEKKKKLEEGWKWHSVFAYDAAVHVLMALIKCQSIKSFLSGTYWFLLAQTPLLYYINYRHIAYEL